MSSTDKWSLLWKGKTVWAGNSPHSAGLGIVFREKDNVEICATDLDPKGRYMCVSCKKNGTKYCLINVHIPDRANMRRSFISNLELKLGLFTVEGTIVLGGGDLNFVFDINRDRSGGTPTSEHTRGSTALQAILNNYVDAQLTINPAAVEFTYTTPSGNIHSRLDRFYIEKHSVTERTRFTIVPVDFSDHSAIIVNICPNNPAGQHIGS